MQLYWVIIEVIVFEKCLKPKIRTILYYIELYKNSILSLEFEQNEVDHVR